MWFWTSLGTCCVHEGLHYPLLPHLLWGKEGIFSQLLLGHSRWKITQRLWGTKGRFPNQVPWGQSPEFAPPSGNKELSTKEAVVPREPQINPPVSLALSYWLLVHFKNHYFGMSTSWAICWISDVQVLIINRSLFRDVKVTFVKTADSSFGPESV